MKKIMTLFIVLTVSVFFVLACASNTTPTPSSAAQQPAGSGVVLSEPAPSTASGSSPAPASDAPVKELTIDMHNFGFTQSDVTINKGDRVRITLSSSSGTHGFALPDFGISTEPIPAGQQKVIEFIADKSGTFNYKCNVPCGEGHRDMKGTLIVN